MLGHHDVVFGTLGVLDGDAAGEVDVAAITGHVSGDLLHGESDFFGPFGTAGTSFAMPTGYVCGR